MFLHVILLEHEQNCNIMLHRLSNTSFEPTKFQCSEQFPQAKLLQLQESFQLTVLQLFYKSVKQR